MADESKLWFDTPSYYHSELFVRWPRFRERSWLFKTRGSVNELWWLLQEAQQCLTVRLDIPLRVFRQPCDSAQVIVAVEQVGQNLSTYYKALQVVEYGFRLHLYN